MSTRSTAKGPPAYVLEGDSDIWSSRSKTAGLIAHLTRRHLAARYRGSTLGFLWSLLNPILMMCVYTFVFQYVLRFETPGVPFPVFFLTGLLAWNFIHTATLNAAASILDNHTLIKQAYFPRIALPLSAVLSNGVNYLVSVPLVVVFNLFFGIHPGWTIVLLPVALVFLMALATGLCFGNVCVRSPVGRIVGTDTNRMLGMLSCGVAMPHEAMNHGAGVPRPRRIRVDRKGAL